jgi:hypothetical protein
VAAYVAADLDDDLPDSGEWKIEGTLAAVDVRVVRAGHTAEVVLGGVTRAELHLRISTLLDAFAA